jgi:hypothetical protein
MTNATTKTSTVIITVPRILTEEQRSYIHDHVKKELPHDVGVLVLDGGATAVVMSDSPVTVDAIPGGLLSAEGPSSTLDGQYSVFPAGESEGSVFAELQRDVAPGLILAEPKGLRTDLACHHAEIAHYDTPIRTLE